MLTLTADKIEAIKQLAEANGMVTQVTKTQVAIGVVGNGYIAVYTERSNGRKLYDFRDRRSTLNESFKAIING